MVGILTESRLLKYAGEQRVSLGNSSSVSATVDTETYNFFKDIFYTSILSVDLLGADGVEFNYNNNDRVEGRDEHEDEVENDEKLKMYIKSIK